MKCESCQQTNMIDKSMYLDYENGITPEQLKKIGFTIKLDWEKFELWLNKNNQFIIVKQITWKDDKDWVVCEYLIVVIGRILSDHLHYQIPFDMCYGDFSDPLCIDNSLHNINELLKYHWIMNTKEAMDYLLKEE